MKTKTCTRCGWPLDPASARGGHTRHPRCAPAADQLDEPMLTPPPDADQLARKDHP